MMKLQKLIDGLKAHKSGAASYESVDEAIRVFEAMRDMDGEKVCKAIACCCGLTEAIDPCIGCGYDDELAPYCTEHMVQDALALIRQQQERIKELEAANASWQKFAPFLYAHGLLNEMEGV